VSQTPRDPGAARTDLVDRLVRRDLLLLRLEAARGRRTARVAGVVGRRLPVRPGPAARGR
jgi:hypothetical protein